MPPHAPHELEEQVGQAFQLTAHAFTPEKACGWKANFHYIIDGVQDRTVIIERKKVNILTGRHGTASCEMRLSAATLVAMFSGKLSSSKAFMLGKIKVSNLKEVMKFRQVFDFKKARQSFSTEPKNPPATHPLLSKMSDHFVSDEVGTWEGHINLCVEDKTWALAIEDGDLQIRDQASDQACDTVTMTWPTFQSLFSPNTSHTELAISGKINCVNGIGAYKLRQLFAWDHIQREQNAKA